MSQCSTSSITHHWSPWWRHQIETFSPLLALCAGNSHITCELPSQCGGALMFSLNCAWTNGLAKNWKGMPCIVNFSKVFLFYWNAVDKSKCHYEDVIMGAMASQITSLTIVYSRVYSGADQRKHQSSALLVFVRGIHRWPVNSPVTWKMHPFDGVIISGRC